MGRIDVCVVGSANLDLVARATRLPGPGETVVGSDFAEHFGGKGLNQVVAAARAGARCAFIASVGDDAAGAALRQVLLDDGVDDSAVQVVDAASGRALIGVDEQGENSIIVVPGANAMLGRAAIERAASLLEGARVVLAQLEVPLEAVIAALTLAHAAGATTVLNPAPAQELPPELLAVCDIVVPNEHEAELVGGVEALLRSGVATVVVTEGRRGARIVTGGSSDRVDAFAVDAVDTTGAGDAFCGAMCAHLAKGASLVEAVHAGAAAGALATTVPGAIPSLPRAAAIEALLETT